jgi:hypothetical protein
VLEAPPTVRKQKKKASVTSLEADLEVKSPPIKRKAKTPPAVDSPPAPSTSKPVAKKTKPASIVIPDSDDELEVEGFETTDSVSAKQPIAPVPDLKAPFVWRVVKSFGTADFQLKICLGVRDDGISRYYLQIEKSGKSCGATTAVLEKLICPVYATQFILHDFKDLKKSIAEDPTVLLFSNTASKTPFETKASYTVDCATSMLYISVRAYKNAGPTIYLEQKKGKNLEFSKFVEFDLKKTFNLLFRALTDVNNTRVEQGYE